MKSRFVYTGIFATGLTVFALSASAQGKQQLPTPNPAVKQQNAPEKSATDKPAADKTTAAKPENAKPENEKPPAVAETAPAATAAPEAVEPKPVRLENEQTGTTQEAKIESAKTAAPESAPAVSDAGKMLPGDVPDAAKTFRRGQLSEEEAAVVPYYNNFLAKYYLGPEDVISVTVFNQEKYSKNGITVPPNGRISYPLIKGGVTVAGRTVEEVEEEITKKLDEYIIDPKVTVSLDRAMSARYSVLGDVGKPGAQIMTRRLSVYEAIAEAGGILSTGNKKEVIVLRSGADGRPYPIMVNLKDIEKGKSVEMVYLVAGDQVIVQGNKIKVWKSLLNTLPILGFARGIFTGGF